MDDPSNTRQKSWDDSEEASMSFFDADITAATDGQPRARGGLLLSTKPRNVATAIETLRTSGSMKALFPTTGHALEAIMINTSGGLTGGDRFDIDASTGQDCELVLTTQAAERAYRSNACTARVDTRLRVASGGFACWLPQELIVFDGAALERRLTIELEQSARLLMVEPVVFGRSAMGERLRDVTLDDRIEIRSGKRPVYIDRMRFDGDSERQLDRSAIGRGARAMASIVYIAPDAEAQLDQVRTLLPETGGASLLKPDTMVLRLLAKDGFMLRQSLVPILETLKGTPLPRSWSL